MVRWNEGHVIVRKAGGGDADFILKAHHDAVHNIAAQNYEQAILDEWAPALTQERIENHRIEFKENKDGAIFVVAETAGEVVGFGMYVPNTKEVSAVYVSSKAGRKGIGAQILHEVEDIARELGDKRVWLKASLNAEKFYLNHGFIREGTGEHTFKSGLKMPCINMHKYL